MPKKKKFFAVGRIIKNGIISETLEEYGWAHSEPQFKMLIWLRTKKKYPRLQIHAEFEVYDITSLTKEKVKKIVADLTQPTV